MSQYRLIQLLKSGLTHQFLLITLIFLSLPSPTAVANDGVSCEAGEYVISAYYSPVAGQQRYATGSFLGDIRLNGRGVMTASGTPVASAPGGFVAAPPCMPFGTKLNIEGLGTFVVLDRGGAIRGSRLDVWMGYGDEGLITALQWGKRSVHVDILDAGAPLTKDFDVSLSLKQLKSYQKSVVVDPFDFIKNLSSGDKGEDVARLQQILKDVRYFDSEVNGIFDKVTFDAVQKFQNDQGLLTSPNFDGSGKFGDSTLISLKSFVVITREKYLSDISKRNLGRGARGDDVNALQRILVKLGLLDAVTGIYDAKTVDAVTKFQINENVIRNDSDPAAGFFGPYTKLALDKTLLKLETQFESTDSTVATDQKSLDDKKLLNYLKSDEMLTLDLKEGDSGVQVSTLQSMLKNLHYLNIEPSGYFGPVTSHAVAKFQQRSKLITSLNDSSAGIVGPQTRQLLNTYVNSKNKLSTISEAKSSILPQVVATEPSKSIVLFLFTTTLKYGDNGAQVKELQKILKSKGYFTGLLTTNYFGEATKDALIQFQLDNNIIDSSDDVNAGVFDGETMQLVNQLSQ